MQSGAYPAMSWDEYQSVKCLSSTMVSTRHRLTWRHAQTEKPDSPEFLLGRAVHAFILQQELFAKMFMLMPGVEGITTKDGKVPSAPKMTSQYKERVEQARADNPDAELLEPEDMKRITTMGQNVRDKCASLLDGVQPEFSIFFSINGVECKSRLDGIDAKNGRIVEIKTSYNVEPRAFAYDARKWGYGIQMAWQGLAVSSALKWTPTEYIIIAVESQPPHGVTIHRLSNAWISEMEIACLNYIDEFAKHCQHAVVWPEFDAGINVIDFSTGDTDNE